MNLKNAIDLNMSMAPQPAAIMALLGGLTAVVIGVRIYATTVGMAIYLVLMVLMLVFAVISLRRVFSRSLFGEEAYRYMLLPISFRCMVMGKVCVGAVHCCAACLVAILALDYCLIKFFGVGGSEFRDGTEATAAAIINLHSILSDGVMTTSSVVFLIGASPVAALLESFFISAMILLAVIVGNLLDPQRDKPQVAIGVAVAVIVLYLASNLLFLWFPGLFFTKDLAVPQLIIAVLLKAAVTMAMADGAARLLEKKYSLY